MLDTKRKELYTEIVIKKLFILFLFCCFCYSASAQQSDTTPVRLTTLSQIKGMVSVGKFGTKKELVILTTAGRKNYSLSGEIIEKEIRPKKNLEKKIISLTGIESSFNIEVSDTETTFDENGRSLSRKTTIFKYKAFEVVSIEEIKSADKEIHVPYLVVQDGSSTTALSQQALSQTLNLAKINLRRIKGMVVSCTLSVKTPVSTLEIEYKTKKDDKYRLILILPNDTRVIKVVDGNPMQLMLTAIKKGDRVDMWYEQRGDQNFARMITILDKN